MPFTLQIGATAPDFKLIGTDQISYSLKNFEKSKGIVLFFTCNHCPYVIASDPVTEETALKYQKEGIAFIAINSNCEQVVPEDSFDNMKKRMETHHFPWVYLRDETQDIAKKYGALKTPHFYLFDEKRKLIYCGRGIDSPRDPSKMKVNDLENALKEFVTGSKITVPLTNPIGCPVKWKGHERHWMPPEACDLV